MYVPALEGLFSWHNGENIRRHVLDSLTRADQAGKVARSAGVATLVLNHFVPADGSVDEVTWRNEASRTFSGDVVVGADLMRI